MNVRRLIATAGFTIGFLFAASARAGTYLDSAALLLDESRRAGDYIQYHLGDVELAALAHKLAEARVKAGRETPVPGDVEKAHPHLLLALEAAERAMAAAQDGDAKRFFVLLVDARREEQMFRNVLGQQKLQVPELAKCERK